MRRFSNILTCACLAATALAMRPRAAAGLDEDARTLANAPVSLEAAANARNAAYDAAASQVAGETAAVLDGAAPQTSDMQRTLHRPERAQAGAHTGVGAEVLARTGSADTGPGWWPLAAVLGFMAICAWFARRWLTPSRGRAGGEAIRVLSRHYLSNRQSLCLARVGRRVVLLGVTPDRISTLSEITDEEEVSAVLVATQRGRAASFTSAFERFMERDARETLDEADETTPAPAPGRMSAPATIDTRQRVGELIERIRELSSGSRVPAEPPERHWRS